MASADLRDELSCSICLNIYKDPVTLRCGHNFCQECIDRVLDTQKASGLYTCPECREEFKERPVLSSARALRNIAEMFFISQSDEKETGIYCTYCVDSPVPAIKSCLLCENSLCGKHLKVHAKSPEHVLSDPTNSPGNRKCSIHKKIVEYFCTEERVCICVYCIAVGEHKGHPVESLDEASEKKKEKLRKDLEMMTSKKAWAEKQVQSLEERKTDVQEKAADVIERVTALFRDIRRELEEVEKRVLSEVSMEEKKISQSLSNLIQHLEIQKDELSRKMSHIEELCKTADPMTVLKDQNSDREEICHTEQEDNMDAMIPREGDFYENSITEKLQKLSDLIKDFPLCIQKPEGVLLDEETAAHNIKISEDLKTASLSAVTLNRPEGPQRFKNGQVLSKRSFSSGRHSWEVDTSNSIGWRVGLCYPSMDRKSYVGNYKYSWCIRRNYNDYNYVYECQCIPFPHKPTSHKFRICLDYEAGKISFYELSDPIRHLHTFTTTFTEPLHLVIYIWNGSMTIT
ncbi:E3 ubiquitin-protein ligase TRIM39-like [Rana temporaria]|uniref:E3 ubiquitin-protein ligase TRIM39-like n=1 Tax=Rana temporaria TaxID=8407 RepID=UPI001AAE0CD8|nr:E3 ubiquitin-protein ligase TRIM39-like [Rana temporaria]XP_040186860.1 E3 ubiquitin-protein ligase TRIM39-like [Rana temporaria]